MADDSIPGSDESLGKTIIFVRKLSIDHSTINNMQVTQVVKNPEDPSAAEGAGGGVRDTVTGHSSMPGAEFHKSKGWVSLSSTLFMYNAVSLCPGKEVYRAKQIHAHGRERDVVVKLIHTGEEHLKELDILLKLTDQAGSENIVKILQSDHCIGLVPRIYIVMEQCLQNLSQYIEKNPFKLVKAMVFFKQLVSAIVFIHDNEIAHRDLKPSNILVTLDCNSIKVADFGISKMIPGGCTKVTMTHPGAGTEGFKAPETYREDKPRLGYKADIFPLGICGYYIFTHGQHPFGTNHYKCLFNIMENKKPDLSQIPEFPDPDKKAQLTRLLESMLQHDPGDRPTAKQAHEDTYFKGGDDANPAHTADPSELPHEKTTRRPVAKISRSIDVSGILQQYDLVLQPQQAKILSDSLAAATQNLRCGDTHSALKCVRDSIPESLTALDVKDFAFMLKREGHYIYAMLMYCVCNNIYKSYILQSSETLKSSKQVSRAQMLSTKNFVWFKEMVTGVRSSIGPLITDDNNVARDIAIKFGMKFLLNFLEDIRAVTGADEDDKVISESSCVVSISRISIDAKDYRYAIDISKEGLNSLEERFGMNAHEVKYYGQLLNNVGEALMHDGKYEEAEKYLERALNAKRAAKYKSRSMKKRDIKFTMTNLDRCREKFK